MNPAMLSLASRTLLASPLASRTFSVKAGKKAAPVVALKASKMKSNKQKSGGSGFAKEDKTSVFIKMLDSQLKGQVSDVDAEYMANQEVLGPLAKKWQRLCTTLHNEHNHNMQCKIDLKWNAREALGDSKFVAAADAIDYTWSPVSRKIAGHTPPIKGFNAEAVKQKYAEQEQLADEERQKEEAKALAEEEAAEYARREAERLESK
jgi:hypothetical protein